MKAARLVLVVLTTSAVSGGWGLSIQSPRATDIDVAVLDAAWAPVTDLEARDFEVRVDDLLVPVTRVTRAPINLSIVLVMDGTTSQPLKRYEMSGAVASEWLPRLGPNDRLRLGLVASPLTMSGWLPDGRTLASVTARGFFDRAPAEPSPIWDATAAAVDALAGERATRLVLLVSDGRATANVSGLEDAAAKAVAAGVPIGVVGESAEHMLAQAGDPAARIRPDASLRWLADETGGLYLPDGIARRSLRPQQDPFAYVRELIATPNRPGPLLVTLTNAMRQRYRLTFAGPADDRAHRVEVRCLARDTSAHWARRLGTAVR